ncbi:unnamed protein product [Arabis nemorensis]|uniref:Uncharacterized protein n=1 Tax=Arabis nemorensis TaxID=586526 RepID=A0A565C0V9_9BRAS|nr:unnamed protein product [Arabis nemorensis]
MMMRKGRNEEFDFTAMKGVGGLLFVIGNVFGAYRLVRLLLVHLVVTTRKFIAYQLYDFKNLNIVIDKKGALQLKPFSLMTMDNE